MFQWIEVSIGGWFKDLGANLGMILFVTFMVSFFWFFGLHGWNMVELIVAPFWFAYGIENTRMYTEGIRTIDGLHIWKRFWEVYTNIGGSGGTLALLLAIMIFSEKRW